MNERIEKGKELKKDTKKLRLKMKGKKSNVSYAVSCLQRRKFYQTKKVEDKKKFGKAGKFFLCCVIF